MPQLDRYELVLRELIADIDAVGPKQVAQEWPDLIVTYRKAQAALSLKNTKQAVS